LAFILNLFRDRRAVLQKLRPGNDQVLPGFEPIETTKSLPTVSPSFKGFCRAHRSFAFVDGHEREELAVDAQHGEHGDHRALVNAPGNLRANLLRQSAAWLENSRSLP